MKLVMAAAPSVATRGALFGEQGGWWVYTHAHACVRGWAGWRGWAGMRASGAKSKGRLVPPQAAKGQMGELLYVLWP